MKKKKWFGIANRNWIESFPQSYTIRKYCILLQIEGENKSCGRNFCSRKEYTVEKAVSLNFLCITQN